MNKMVPEIFPGEFPPMKLPLENFPQKILT